MLVAAGAAVTVVRCTSMQAMGDMPIPGGWTMSMAWMPTCGQTRLAAAASFVGMWLVMMAAMMLPSLLPMLWRYRRAVRGAGEARLGLLTVLVAVTYFFVWAAFGIAVFALGAAATAAAMHQPALAGAVPIVVGAVVLIGGALQFTAWKAHHLACCRNEPGRGSALPGHFGTAARHGLFLGLHCCCSCAGLTAIVLAIGMMDLRIMAFVTGAITAERLAPAGERLARIIGVVAVATGLAMIVRAAGTG